MKADPALARQYYRQSGSAPAVLGLWLMGASELAGEVGGPLAFSVVVVAVTMLFFQLRKRGRAAGDRRPSRGHRPLVAAAAAAAGGRFGGGAGARRRAGGAAGAMMIEREGDEVVGGGGGGGDGE